MIEILSDEAIRELVLLNDRFMTICLKNPRCTELVLRIILSRKDLHVKQVKTQYTIEGMGRSVRLDVLAEDDDGKLYNIEIQRASRGAEPKRARLNGAALDCNSLARGESFNKLGENYVIFITERDVLKGGLPLYTIERVIKENGRDFGDGSHILYVNASHRDLNTELGRLMHDFLEPDPDKMYYTELAQEAKYYKSDEKGVGELKGDFEDIFNRGVSQGLKKGREDSSREFAANMLRLGKLTVDEIVQTTGLALSKVQELADSMGITIA